MGQGRARQAGVVTMRCALALYKGPPSGSDWRHVLTHYGIRLWTCSRYSHAELLIDQWCYSSSVRDGGVRSKQIDLTSGRWDVVDLELPNAQVFDALLWFSEHDGQGYDWPNIFRFVLPFVRQDKKRWVCFESIGAALGMAGAHRLTANDLHAWALQNAPSDPHKEAE